MKKLSIITICYNEPNLENTCKSIVNQIWQDFEWIVIDGGSNKETQKIWNKYKYRIDRFISEPDNGIYDAYNKGIKLAKGKFLNFMNAGDCFYDNNVLYNISQFFILNIDIIYGNSFCIFPSTPNKNILKTYPNTVNKKYFFDDNLNTQSMIIKRNLFSKYGAFNTSYKICADWDKWITFIKNKKKFIYIPTTISKYNMEGLSNKINYEDELHRIQKKHFTPKEIYRIENNVQPEQFTNLEQIFSVKNNDTHKIITILGIHIKIRRQK